MAGDKRNRQEWTAGQEVMLASQQQATSPSSHRALKQAAWQKEELLCFTNAQFLLNL